MDTTTERSFARSILPWAIAAVMLLVYLLTLDKVVTLQSVGALARVSGADWNPVYTQPLYWLVTLPLRWLPAGMQLIGLNFVAALCAALSLALLARCVAILPHDRTQFQRDKLTGEDSFLNIRLAWVPVVFAVLVCGLQRTFWEHAIINTGEVLDLLLFAYCVRCLLEYRIDERNSWLYKLAFVYGLAVTNNFAMIAFFPALLVALVWIKGLRFFRFDFLARMFLLGLAGLSLYLLLPLVQMQSDVQSVTFWQALKANLTYQKQFITAFPRWRAGWIGLYAFLPLLLAGIRWPRSFGDTSPVGSVFTNVFAFILHAALLAFCLYIAFDPPVGPRRFGLGLAYLPCYFLAALSIGYYTGFLLMVFSGDEVKSSRRAATMPPAVGYAVTAIVCGGALFVVGKLAAQNYPNIRETTAPWLHDYATSLAKSLPEKPAFVFSDDAVRLHALAALLGNDALDKHVLVNTVALADRAYHKFLQKRYGDRWPQFTVEKGFSQFPPHQMLQVLSALAEKRELVYLHPSFGYFFETFYLEPRKLVYVMKRYPADALEVPLPSTVIVAEQNETWNALAAGPWKSLQAALASEPNEPASRATAAAYVGALYSRALDWWGVELQRLNQFDEAAKFFDQAIALNPDNVSAIINKEGNVSWRNGRKRLEKFSPEAEAKLKMYPGMNSLLTSCGPIDVPEFSLEFAQTYVQTGHFRQAGHMVRRALAYAPEDIIYQTALANVEVMAGNPERALEIISKVRARSGQAMPGLQIEITRVEAFARAAQGDFAAGEKLLEGAIQKFPGEDASYNALSQLHVSEAMKRQSKGDINANVFLTNAVRVIERHVKAQPQNPSAHFNLGNLQMFVDNRDAAVREFTQVLDIQKDNSAALLNRAIAYLLSKKYDEANKDYLEMLNRYTSTDFRVYYGLGEIAYQKQDWKKAKEHYTEYLRYAPPNAGEAQTIRQRLEEVKKKL